MTQWVKKLPAVPETQETWVQSLGWEDPLEKGMTTHSSILAWKNPMDRGAWRATVERVKELDMTEQLNKHTYLASIYHRARLMATIVDIFLEKTVEVWATFSLCCFCLLTKPGASL